MRKVWALAGVAVVAVLVAIAVRYAFAPRATLVKAGDVAPDFALPHHNQPGQRGTLSELKGDPVVLVRFDSSWGGTGTYLDDLERAHRRFLRDGLVVVGVALDPPQEQRALEFMLANRKVSFTVLLDPGGRVTGPLYGTPRGAAETYLIDAAGRVVSVHQKPRAWTSRTGLAALGALLPTPTPSPLDRPVPSG